MTENGTPAVAGTSSGHTGHHPQGGRLFGKQPMPPVAQTPEELRRECLGTIAGAARDIERSAMDGKVDALKVHCEFLKVQMRRLETIMGTAQQKLRTI